MGGPATTIGLRTRQDPVSVTVAQLGRAVWPAPARPGRPPRAAPARRGGGPPRAPRGRPPGGSRTPPPSTSTATTAAARGGGRARPRAAEAQVARLGRPGPSAPPMLAPCGAGPCDCLFDAPTSVCLHTRHRHQLRNRRNASRGMIGRSRLQASSPAPPRRGPGRASGLSTAVEQARCSGRTACSSPSQYADLDLAQRNSAGRGTQRRETLRPEAEAWWLCHTMQRCVRSQASNTSPPRAPGRRWA